MDEPSPQRLMELLAINREIAAATDYSELLRRVVEHTAEFLDAGTVVLLLDNEIGDARIAASIGLEPEKIEGFTGTLDERISQKVCKLIGCDELRFLAAPVIEHDTIEGVLAVNCRQACNPQDALVLSALADQIAIALSNAKHMQRLENALSMLRETDRR